jgi:hypothetical protein
MRLHQLLQACQTLPRRRTQQHFQAQSLSSPSVRTCSPSLTSPAPPTHAPASFPKRRLAHHAFKFLPPKKKKNGKMILCGDVRSWLTKAQSLSETYRPSKPLPVLISGNAASLQHSRHVAVMRHVQCGFTLISYRWIVVTPN